ncbi:MAG: choice-of-anchor tandem repeat GloVer-containing protein [Candidatus Sulfotelmatobacter sp.]|jgi:uncharacterized repeat protein (TIGR03803 family)
MNAPRISRFIKIMLLLSAVLAVTLGLSLSAHAQSGAIIGSLQSVATFASLVRDSSGNIYGVENAGEASCQEGDCGKVFQLTQNSGIWMQTTLYTFTGSTDGSQPAGGLILDSAGNLYGTASAGGDLAACNGAGCGVVFKLSKSAGGEWFETVLYTFKGGSDGGLPTSLIQNTSGVLFGATSFGGNLNTCAGSGCGVVFQLSAGVTGWNETVLYSFTAGSNGQSPAGLIFGSSGNILGTAIVDLYQCANFCGALVFELSKRSKGWQESTLHKFQGQFGFQGAIGPQYFSPLISDASGNIYGTAYSGGKGCSPTGCGFIFKLSPQGAAWKESTLYSFGGEADGAGPTAGLVFDPDGNLYGGTQNGNVTGCNPFEYGYCGQLFKLSQGSNGWTVAAVYGTPYFWTPTGNMLTDASGNIYGSACDEYYYNGGDVLEIIP